MRFKIIHQTKYIFDSEVSLEPHLLRFKPRATSYLAIHDFSLTILPKPIGYNTIKDEENNTIDFFRFNNTTKKLTITAETVLEVKPFNPFDFVLYPNQFNQLPFEYDTLQKKLLFSALQKKTASDQLLEYGNSILKASNFNTVNYLTALTKSIQKDFSVKYRELGPPFSPNKTFQLKKGSCRDLSWMQINLLRHQGIAARFVSGYYYYDMEKPHFELHAWVEVFLPGSGWLGLDPSYGILACNTHFPVSSSAFPEKTMPVSGGIRGSSKSKLITQLNIEKV